MALPRDAKERQLQNPGGDLLSVPGSEESSVPGTRKVGEDDEDGGDPTKTLSLSIGWPLVRRVGDRQNGIHQSI
jgi:hypothetical protein